VRLTIVGSGPARPQPDTPASGILVEADGTALLLDCGPGVIGALRRWVDPTALSAVFVGHMHADHYLDVAPLRYLFPWGERASRRLPVLLPPGGRARLDALATAISERDGFFDDAFEVSEYAGGVERSIGSLRVRPFNSQHYVPAWGVEILDGASRRIVYAGDTGPTVGLVDVARGADLLVCEATLDDPDVDVAALVGEGARAVPGAAQVEVDEVRPALEPQRPGHPDRVHLGHRLEARCDDVARGLLREVAGRHVVVDAAPRDQGGRDDGERGQYHVRGLHRFLLGPACRRRPW